MSDSDSQLFQLKLVKDLKIGDIFLGNGDEVLRVTSTPIINDKFGTTYFEYVSVDPAVSTYYCDNAKKKILVRLS